jgi:magnesium transporter
LNRTQTRSSLELRAPASIQGDNDDSHSPAPIGIFVRGPLVLTFEEKPSNLLSPVLTRLYAEESLLRRARASHLAQRILYTVIDAHLARIDLIAQQVDAIDDAIAVVTSDRRNTPSFLQELRELHRLMRGLRTLWRHATTLREVALTVSRDEFRHFGDETRLHRHDAVDHITHAVDLASHYRDIITDMRGLIVNTMDLSMNRAMRLLTAVSTIFIPLSFVAGVYGMNFDTSSPYNMPELGWKYGYPGSLVLMAGIGVGLGLWFRRNGWVTRG